MRDVGHGADVRNVRQPRGQAPGPDGQGSDVPAPARGERATPGVAACAQLRLVDGRGAAGRVGGRPAERGHRTVLRRAGRGRAHRRPPETGRRDRGRGRVGRVLRARVQRAVLRRFRRGRARPVHTERRLLPAGRMLGHRARPVGRRTPPLRRGVRAVRGHRRAVRFPHRHQEPRLARRRVPLQVRHPSEPAKM